MTELNKQAFSAMVLDVNGFETVEQVAAWAMEVLSVIAPTMVYIPFLNDVPTPAVNLIRRFDGSGTYRTSGSFALPSSASANSLPMPMWKSMENTITVPVPASYYVL